MPHPASRVLAMLELLQTHRSLRGADLAARLAVDERTVRRYAGTLADLGIPVTAERGRYGGYRLLPGFKLPPLMLTGDEAVAVVLGLLAADRLGLAVDAPAGATAEAKITRVLPVALADRLTALRASLGLTLRRREDPAPPGSADLLLTLGTATRSCQRLVITYRAPGRPPAAQPGQEDAGVPVLDGTGQPFRESTGQLSREGAVQPSWEGTDQLLREGVGQPLREGADQPSWEGTDQLSREGVGQPLREGADQPSWEGTDQLSREGVGQPLREGADQPSWEGTDQLSPEGVGQLSQEGAGQPVLRDVGEQVREGAAQPVREVVGQPLWEGAGQPVLKGVGEQAREGAAPPVREGVGQPSVRVSRREVDPYGLVFHNGRWYLVAHDHRTDEVRSFRLDRLAAATTTGVEFEAPPNFDAVAHVTRQWAGLPWKWPVEVLIEADVAQVRRRIPAALADVVEVPEGVRLTCRVQSLPGMAQMLAGLAWPFTVVSPDELRTALADHAARLVRYAAR